MSRLQFGNTQRAAQILRLINHATFACIAFVVVIGLGIYRTNVSFANASVKIEHALSSSRRFAKRAEECIKWKPEVLRIAYETGTENAIKDFQGNRTRIQSRSVALSFDSGKDMLHTRAAIISRFEFPEYTPRVSIVKALVSARLDDAKNRLNTRKHALDAFTESVHTKLRFSR